MQGHVSGVAESSDGTGDGDDGKENTMSETNPCNYCVLQGIRERAKREGNVVTLRPGALGTDVFVHPEYESLRGKVRIPSDPRNAAGNLYYRYDRFWAATLMEISEECMC
jgi:hypothetical protein